MKETESSSHYKNLAPKRPVCQKLNDHLTLGVSTLYLLRLKPCDSLVQLNFDSVNMKTEKYFCCCN